MIELILFMFGVLFSVFFITFNKKRTPEYDGAIIITEKENGKKLFSLDLHEEPEDLEGKDVATFRIIKTTPSSKIE